MPTEYVVTDEEGSISFDDKKHESETFRTFKAASKRAEALAHCSPGESIRIYGMVAECIAPVAAPRVNPTTTPKK